MLEIEGYSVLESLGHARKSKDHMNRLRHKRLDDQLGRALHRAMATQEGYLEPDSRIPCNGILIGGSVAAGIAVSSIKSLDRLWGFQGSGGKAPKLLETFSLRILSTWLSWLDGDRPDDEKDRARQLWGEVLLTLFDDLSEDSLAKFVGRDLQYRYEMRIHEEKQRTGEGGGPLVGVTLLLSDALVSLGGQPLLRPTPITGYPYESIRDMMTRGGVKEIRSDLEAFVDSIRIFHLVASGAKVCADYCREKQKNLDEAVAPILAQLKELLTEGHTIDELRQDSAWSTWIEYFETRGALGTGT